MMLTIFVNSQGIIYHKFSAWGTRLMALDYCTMLIGFIDALEERCPEKWVGRHTWALLQEKCTHPQCQTSDGVPPAGVQVIIG